MLDLLSPNRHHTSLSPASQNEDAANEAHATLQSLLDRGVEPGVEEIPENIVYIDLLPDDLPSSLINSGGEATSWMSTNKAIAEERSWTEHGRGGEVIWPPELEAALMEGVSHVGLSYHSLTDVHPSLY